MAKLHLVILWTDNNNEPPMKVLLQVGLEVGHYKILRLQQYLERCTALYWANL